MLFCVINKVTGLHCPGCGATRAVSALMRFDIRAAFGFNPLFMVLLPFITAALMHTAYVYIRYNKAPKPHRWDVPAAVGIGVVVVLYTVARNLEMFAWLAP